MHGVSFAIRDVRAVRVTRNLNNQGDTISVIIRSLAQAKPDIRNVVCREYVWCGGVSDGRPSKSACRNKLVR